MRCLMAKSINDIKKRQLTLRLSLPQVQVVKAMAKRRKTTVNAFVVSLVEACALEEQEEMLKRAYEQLGSDSDVTFAFDAQSAVARNG